MKKLKKYDFSDIHEETIGLIILLRPGGTYDEINSELHFGNYFFIYIDGNDEIKWYKDEKSKKIKK